MTSGQETERVYSYNPGAHMGQYERKVPEPNPSNQPTGDHSHKPGGRPPLLCDRPTVSFPATEYHHP